MAQSFDCLPAQQIKWEELTDGVSWVKYDLAFTPYLKENQQWSGSLSRSVTVRAFKIDYLKHQLLFHRPENDLTCDPQSDRYIKKMLDDHGGNIIGAINANFFVMPNGNILGMAIDENKIWSPDLSNLTISSAGVFSIGRNGPLLESREQFINRFGPVISEQDAKSFSFAVQAYPKLVVDNQLQVSDSVLNVHLPRTSIGITNNPQEIILVTIDARGINDTNGMTLFEYAHFIKTQKCGVGQKTALNLDGGGSTAFAIPTLNLFEQVDRCRHLGNILTIQAR